MTEPEYIDPSEVQPGPIRHESLPPELLDRIKAVYEVVGSYLGTTLEHFEISFMRDSDPVSEVIVWRSIVAAWVVYHEKHLDNELLPDEDEKKLLASLIAISTGVEDVEALDVPADVGRKLLACYGGLGEAE